jgi:hypothetical protein
VRALAPILIVAASSLLLLGCGNERAEPPSLDRLGAPGPTEEFVNPGAVSFRHPRSWHALAATPPQYATLASGGALAAVYAYPRTDLGTDPASVEASRRRLIKSLRLRDPGFLIERTELTEVDGAPAVELRGRGTIAGRPVEARALHVYKPAVEWVIDAYASPGKFAEANRIAFGLLLKTIELDDDPPELGGQGDGEGAG